ncbi:MAG: DNA internalization-related competence protein ComEC/Rec2 [bacterium]
MRSKPALKVLLLLVAGFLAGRYFDFPVPLLILLTFFPLLVAFILWYSDKGHALLIELCLAAGLVGLGIVRYELTAGYFPANHISKFTHLQQPVAVSGLVVKYPERRLNKTNLTVASQEIFARQRVFSTAGRILVSLPFDTTSIQYGDEVLIRGLLRLPRDRRNPGEFDYRAYLQSQGVFAVINLSRVHQIKVLSSGHGSWFVRQWVLPVKSYLDTFVERLPPREAALLRGLMIGERGEIPPPLKEAFAKLGVIHILAVSGLHVGFVMLIFMAFFGIVRLPYPARVLGTLLCLLFYAYLTNLKPPVVRASVMGGLLLLGTALERKTDVFNTLSLAALVILIFNPLELFQSGFQLSFAAVASIVYLYPRLKAFGTVQGIFKQCGRHPMVRYLLELLLVSAAAFLGTLPFTVLYFNRLPNFSLLANLVVVPLAFCGLASTAVAATVHLLLPGLAQIYLAAAWFFIHTMLEFVEWASALPGASWQIYRLPWTLAFGYFIALILISNIQHRKTKFLLLCSALLLANLLVWNSAAGNAHDLQVIFFDVGQGDAALLTLPDGRHLMVDGGPRGRNYDAGKWVIAPYLKREGIEKIDALVLSHADTDHLGGFPYILRHFQVNQVWDNGLGKHSRIYRDYLGLVDSLHIRRRILSAGDVVADFEPVQILVLHPCENFLRDKNVPINDASLVLKVSYGEEDLLFLGDVEMDAEHQIAKYGDLLASEVVKVAHHGSKTSSSPELLKQIQPRLAIISVGEMNKFGHPSAEVLARLSQNHAKILRTDRDAAVILTIDGQHIQQIRWK